MAILQRAAWTGVDNLRHDLDIYLVKHNPRLTLQVKKPAIAADAISRVLAEGRIKIDINFLAGVDTVTRILKIFIHDIASLFVLLLSIAPK